PPRRCARRGARTRRRMGAHHRRAVCGKRPLRVRLRSHSTDLPLMKAVSALLSRTLDAIEIAFEAVGALWRVAARGAFAPDALSYGGARFAALSAEDVLAQEIGLNAADVGEAKKAIALDAERLLPLAPDLVVYDVA